MLNSEWLISNYIPKKIRKVRILAKFCQKNFGQKYQFEKFFSEIRIFSDFLRNKVCDQPMMSLASKRSKMIKTSIYISKHF